MPDPVIELLDLALETLTLNFDEFLLPDHQVSGLEVERLEVRITGIYNKITIISGNIVFAEYGKDICIIFAMIYEVCRYIGSVPGYSEYDKIVSEKRNDEGKLVPELEDIRRLINIKQKLTGICFFYCSIWNLKNTLSKDQKDNLQGRINDAIAKGKANAAAANAFLEGAADANPENAPAGYQPPHDSLRGDKFREIVESDDLHKEVASYLKGGKSKRKSKKHRNKNKKTRLRKRRNTRRKTKQPVCDS